MSCAHKISWAKFEISVIKEINKKRGWCFKSLKTQEKKWIIKNLIKKKERERERDQFIYLYHKDVNLISCS